MGLSQQVSLVGAAYIDVNPRIGVNSLPDRLPDDLSVKYCSLPSLLQCPIGARGPIFQPRYGTWLYNLLQEPVDAITAAKIMSGLVNALGQWEPRISIDTSNTVLTPLPTLPGYRLYMPYTVLSMRKADSYSTTLSAI